MDIDKSFLVLCGFSFSHNGKVATRLVDCGDVLTALRTMDDKYVVRGLLSPVDEPMILIKELITHLAFYESEKKNGVSATQ